jgi:hypothetical protein
MATKQFYATGSFKYGTRMMQAGDAVEMDGPTARLFTALNKITDRAPPSRKPVERTAEAVAKPRAPRKRAAKKSK